MRNEGVTGLVSDFSGCNGSGCFSGHTESEGLPSSEGMKILDAKGCLACHTVNGNAGVGPTFKGAWGSTVHLTDGSTRTLDSAFFVEKVHNPTALSVNGYPPVMPPIPLTDDEIKQIEAYLEGLQN